jgi:hypothetical protein
MPALQRGRHLRREALVLVIAGRAPQRSRVPTSATCEAQPSVLWFPCPIIATDSRVAEFTDCQLYRLTSDTRRSRRRPDARRQLARAGQGRRAARAGRRRRRARPSGPRPAARHGARRRLPEPRARPRPAARRRAAAAAVGCGAGGRVPKRLDGVSDEDARARFHALLGKGADFRAWTAWFGAVMCNRGQRRGRSRGQRGERRGAVAPPLADQVAQMNTAGGELADVDQVGENLERGDRRGGDVAGARRSRRAGGGQPRAATSTASSAPLPVSSRSSPGPLRCSSGHREHARLQSVEIRHNADELGKDPRSKSCRDSAMRSISSIEAHRRQIIDPGD